MPQDPRSTQPNTLKTLIENMTEELFNQKDLSAIDRYFSAEYIWNDAPPGFHGREGVRNYCMAFFRSFPDYTLTNLHILCEGDRVVQHFLGRGSHLDTWMHIPATKRSIECKGITIYRVENAQLVEGWMVTDSLKMMQDLDLVRFVDPSSIKSPS